MRKIKLKHFMSLEDVELEFDERNIINLCGYNDSGKSAVTRAMEVMFFNSYSMDQVNFITDTLPGVEYWEIGIEFEDGVEYRRRKYIDGSSLWELEREGEILFTNKLPNGSLSAMADTPEPIRDYLGVIQDDATDEKLNVRRNTDRLFLIETTGGDNYKILNSVLKSDVISEASKQLNIDKNKLNGNIASTKAKRELLEEQVESIPVSDEEIVAEIKQGLKRTRENLTGLVRLAGVAEKRNEVLKVKVNPKVEEVSTEQLQGLQGIVKGLETFSRPVRPEVTEIDLGAIQGLQGVIELQRKKESHKVDPQIAEVDLRELKSLQGIVEAIEKKESIKVQPEVEQVDTDALGMVTDIAEKYNKYAHISREYKETMKEHKAVREELAKISAENDLTQCKNCGSLT